MREVKFAIKYGRTSITLEKVISTLMLRDLELKIVKASSSNGENYFFVVEINKREIFKEEGIIARVEGDQTQGVLMDQGNVSFVTSLFTSRKIGMP